VTRSPVWAGVRAVLSSSLTLGFLLAAPAVPGNGRLGAQVPRLTPPPPCRASSPDPDVAALRPRVRRGTSIAVLEFDSRVMDQEQVHLAPSLTARLRSRLATLPGVSVESRGTIERVFAASGGRIDSLLSVLANQYAVTGDVIPQRDRIDVTVRITPAGAAAPRWERVFAYSDMSLRDIEDAVATAVSDLVGARTPAPRAVLSDAAYEQLLRGDYFLARHELGSADSARRVYEAAFEEEARAAVAAARAARARGVYLERLGAANARLTDEYVLAGLAMADSALQIDSTLAEAWTARAVLLRFRNPSSYQGVVEAHERAVALAPESADAHEAYGVSLTRLGRDAAAEQRLRRALTLDPNRPSALRALAELEYLRRRSGPSCALVNAAIGADSYDPLAYSLRARVRMQLGEFRDAFSDAETAGRMSGAPWGSALELLVTAKGTTVDDARLEARRVASAKLRPGVMMTVAEGTFTSLALDAFGDRDKAFEALSRVEPLGIEFAAALRDPGFDAMRRDARFRRVNVGERPGPEAVPQSGRSGRTRE